MLEEIIDHAVKNNIQLIVYKIPEINLIEYPGLFTKTNESIKTFFNTSDSILYIDGNESFKDGKSKDFRLSKYDGHPNERAHQKMAKEVFEIIKETNSIYSESLK